MMFKSTGSTSPPRADLAFRVGIVGHRPNRLPKDTAKLDALRQLLRSALQDVKAEVLRYADGPECKAHYSTHSPILRAVSPLAEGSDRMFAEEALALGYALSCPMPFAQEEFEKDFLPPDALEDNSRERFRDILQRAHDGAGLTTFELDGERTSAGDAYGVAGRVVLNQSDLLIAVWDGGRPAGGGGTVDTLRDAVRYHVPVLWIDALEPDAWQLLLGIEDLDCLESEDRCVPRRASEGQARNLAETITRVVRDEIALPKPPETHRQPTTQSRAPQYFHERRPWFNFAFTWKLFRDVVGSGTFRWPKLIVVDFVEQIRGEWPTREDADTAPPPQGPSDVEDWVNRRLRTHYAWSDKRSDLYADAYRSAYVLTYLLSAAAVLVALPPLAVDLPEWLQLTCVVLELVMLILILLMLAFGRGRHWHERWMEYRLLAELIRQLRFLVPLGGGRPFPHVPTHLAGYGNLTQTWMYWHMRAIARSTGLPSAKVRPAYVLDCLQYLAQVVGVPKGGQIQFHHATEARSERIAHRLHLASAILFGLTFCGIVVHLVLDLAEPEHWTLLKNGLVVASATLPAMGAALAGINNQGEFARLAKRSAAMADGFNRFKPAIESLQASAAGTANAPKLSQVTPLAGKVADMMVDEVSDWRVVFIDRPQPAA